VAHRPGNAIGWLLSAGARLRDRVDLDTLSAELLMLVDQTIQPTRLRPSPPDSSDRAGNQARPATWAY
jgi:hypothetical protein